jgi:hypothetical protein
MMHLKAEDGDAKASVFSTTAFDSLQRPLPVATVNYLSLLQAHLRRQERPEECQTAFSMANSFSNLVVCAPFIPFAQKAIETSTWSDLSEINDENSGLLAG